MTYRAEIAPACLRAIDAHASRALPAECCGTLLGRDRADGVRLIVRSLPATNAAADPTRGFELAPADLLAAERAARDAGLAVTGVYHSHPASAPEPSARDRAAAVPSWSFLILGRGGLRSYRGEACGALREEQLA